MSNGKMVELTEEYSVYMPPVGNQHSPAEIVIEKGTPVFLERGPQLNFGWERSLVSIPISKGVKICFETKSIKKLKKRQ